jgi:hypothetical protein
MTAYTVLLKRSRTLIAADMPAFYFANRLEVPRGRSDQAIKKAKQEALRVDKKDLSDADFGYAPGLHDYEMVAVFYGHIDPVLIGF